MCYGTGHSSSVSKTFRINYVEYGYRSGDLNFEKVLYSLFSFHNESMNIWSHLIGFVCMFVSGISVSIDLFQKGNKFSDIFALELYIICAALCLLLSSVYHWFGCLSEECHQCLLRLDLTGVALLVAGSFLPGVYYGFYCSPNAQQVHLCLTFLVLVIGVSTPWLKFEIYGRNVRPFVYAFLVILGFIPFAHWILITPAIIRSYFVKGYLLMFFWYGLGFTVFISKAPEYYFPKSFLATQLMASHTLWHICVLNAIYCWFHFILQYQSLLNNFQCHFYEKDWTAPSH
mmetsp:Transcript_1820/g.2530  ORF Transcript_1820/g.2530 Transcript_1820/m.2530 type:complete len:287 (-) Transcript_1820:116-976(-)